MEKYHDTKAQNMNNTDDLNELHCYLEPSCQRGCSFCTIVWCQNEIETWYGHVFLPYLGSNKTEGALPLKRVHSGQEDIFQSFKSGEVVMHCLNRFEILVKMW